MKKSDMEKACIGAFGKEMFDSKAKRNPQRSFAEGFLSQRCQDAATHLDCCNIETVRYMAGIPVAARACMGFINSVR